MAVNQLVSVVWSGSGRTYTAPDQAVAAVGSLTFIVPRDVVVANVGGAVSVTYTVSRTAEALKQSSAPVLFQIPALTDTTALVLNGLAVRTAQDWPRYGGEYDDNWARREARGGTPPYRYASSAPSIASITADGKVVGLRNGTATITVTDQPGVVSSYTVQVSNVWTLTFSDTAMNCGASANWAIQQGGKPFTHIAIWQFFSHYVYPLPAPYSTRTHWLGDGIGGCGNPGTGAILIAGETGHRTCYPINNLYHACCLKPAN
ncbi:Ig-like domain-containing protein [Pseudomonas putida]